MHSPDVSVLASSAPNSKKINSSTENSELNQPDHQLHVIRRGGLAESPTELPLAPKGCGERFVQCACRSMSPAKMERTESVLQVNPLDLISYQNEKQIGASAGLLKGANTSEIYLFSDRRRSETAATVNVVMACGAEGAAGGCDAV